MIPVHREVIMDKNVEHVLVDAIENKQSLTVVYLGREPARNIKEYFSD